MNRYAVKEQHRRYCLRVASCPTLAEAKAIADTYQSRYDARPGRDSFDIYWFVAIDQPAPYGLERRQYETYGHPKGELNQ